MTTPKRSLSADPVAMSLSTQAARLLTTTTKTRPQMLGISPRWLLKVLPWVQVEGGVYRVNRRLSHAVDEGTLTFTQVGAHFRVIPGALGALPILHGFEDAEVLEALADRFVQREFAPGAVLAQAGQPAEHLVLIVRGRVRRTQVGAYGDTLELGVLADGDHFGAAAVVQQRGVFSATATAVTACTALLLERRVLGDFLAESPPLCDHLQRLAERLERAVDKDGQAAIELSAGHQGEVEIPTTFVAYERHPREYELSVAQTILNVHTRVADLYNGPLDQVQEQLRLTIEALREQQEHELINNREFGLLHSVHHKQRLQTRSGPPTPDDMDELLCRRRKTQAFLLHPSALAAFGRQCNLRGVYPETSVADGKLVQAWRGVPMLPCNKIPVTAAGITTILALRTGAEHQGVVGLQPATLPDQVEPGLNVRFMGISDKAILRYLVSAYYSVAVLIPDALGALVNVEVRSHHATV